MKARSVEFQAPCPNCGQPATWLEQAWTDWTHTDSVITHHTREIDCPTCDNP